MVRGETRSAVFEIRNGGGDSRDSSRCVRRLIHKRASWIRRLALLISGIGLFLTGAIVAAAGCLTRRRTMMKKPKSSRRHARSSKPSS